jgi:MoaA/NifB/PqqE/SkfB family radical SAM enzyme
MQVNELVIEITRRCNAKCRHCLRGGAQNKNIADETIDKLLDGVDYISTLTFTGGEPSLAVDRIRYITKEIKARGISLGGFFMYTNGQMASLELIHALMDLYAYVHPSDRNETCSLVISEDQYHAEIIDNTEARNLYSCLSFFRPTNHKYTEITSVIAEGRAKDWGHRPADRNDLVISLDDDGKVVQDDGVIYVNVLGDVIPSCNLSYVSQKKAKIGNVHEKPLAEILRQLVPAPDKDEDLIVNHNDELKEAA